MAKIYLKSFCHVDKQCLLREKKNQSKEYNKESLHNNEKHCGFDTLRLQRMEYV